MHCSPLRGLWLLPLLLLLPKPASATSDFERAQAEFSCKDDDGAADVAVVDDLFDEQALPQVVTERIGRAQSESQTGSEDQAAEEAEAAQAAEEELDPQALADWRAGVERYEERTLEFALEVDRIIRRKYTDERTELKEGYERLLGSADIEERQLRDQAIDAHERFVKDHPNSPYTARRMFRLAELYFEKSDEDYLAANIRYDEMGDLWEQGKLEYLPEPPEKDLRRSIALYKRIIRQFPDYSDLGVVYYTLGYCYSDETSRHLDSGRAEQTYQALLDNVEDSPYRAQAYFRLGDLYFEENQHERALAYYSAVVDEFEEKGTDSFEDTTQERLYELALYKLAWAQYKLVREEEAIGRFMTLLDWAQVKEDRTGKAADLKTESIRYLAVSFSDLALERDISPVEYGISALVGRREAPWAFDVLVELGSILTDQARFEEAIEAYERVQMLQPLHPMGPEFQHKVVVLNQNLIVPDADGAAQARVELTNRYGLESEWFAANKNDKEATSLAEKYILESLQQVAIAYRVKAQESNDPNDYLLAARKYVEYLDRYPFAPNAYELNFYLAECYFWTADLQFKDSTGEWTNGWEQSIVQYASLFGFPETEFQKQAILGIMFSHKYLLEDADRKIEDTPEALANIKPPLGETIEFATVDIEDLEQNYVRSVRWVQREYPDFDNMAGLLFDIG